MNEINSVQNERVKQWSKLQIKKYRDRTNQFLIEGEHLIEEALKSNCVRHILVLKGLEHSFCQRKEAIAVTQDILDRLSQNQSSVSMIAVCDMPKMEYGKKQRGVILDGVQDPGNLGTIIRTALSFGYDFILLSLDCVDLYNDKVIRSTQGALFQIPIMRCDLAAEIESLKEESITVFGTSLRNAVPLKQIQKRESYAVVLGNEGQGVREEILNLCDQNIFIEMDCFESLNVGVAAGICLYELRRG